MRKERKSLFFQVLKWNHKKANNLSSLEEQNWKAIPRIYMLKDRNHVPKSTCWKDRTPWLVRLDDLWGQYSNQSPQLFLNSSSKFQNTTNICRHPWLPKTYVCTHTKSKLIECDSWLGMSKQHSNSRTEIPHCDCTHPRGSWATVWIAVSLPPPQPPWRIQVWFCLTSLLFSEWCQDSEGQVG